jgi:hypothetical protein
MRKGARLTINKCDMAYNQLELYGIRLVCTNATIVCKAAL